ncbi:hypothetical protein QJS10_CPB14g00359 [Acorus calamus]|uniref:signal-recognition-particle GTPase n=1 Tax=Acorus calamus TaxID=4465 RepID=A0AAV9DDV2_ACOCL|nr:hypothetical protein QJS10_CPB14g00359 [Acorus calamus]
MVLAELGGSISRALQRMNNAPTVDEKVFGELINEIARALLQADVDFKVVADMRSNIKKIVNLDDLAAGHNKRKIIQQAVFNELCKMLDAGKPSYTPKKGKPSSGKTTTCTKYAHYHQKKGWKPALVCSDTFRAGAFDQLKQNATKAKIPFYGSYMESDPVKIAVEGVERFKKENCDLIIVDTSGRHKQEAALFEEMRQVSEATKPDLVIFVMDSSIGQAVKLFPLESSPRMGDWSGFMDKIHEVVPMDQQPELLQKLSEGKCSLRIMYEQFQHIRKMGPMGQVYSMIPGFSAELMPKDHEKESQARIKRYMTMMDSMTNDELDSTNPKIMTESRILRIARGSGHHVVDVVEMLEDYKRFAKTWSNLKGIKIPKKGEMSALSRNMNAQHMSKGLPPHILKQIGGMGSLQNLMKRMGTRDMMNGMVGGGGDR